MLEIYVGGRKLALNSNTAVTLVMSNPFFESGGIPTPYSLTYSVPKTPNLGILNYANRIASTYDFKAKLPTVICFGGIEVASGVQTIESIDDDSIELSFNGVVLPDTSNLHLQNIDLRTLQLAKATLIRETDPDTGLAVERWNTDGSATMYADLLQKEMQHTYPVFAAPTMSIKGAELVADEQATEATPTYVNQRATRVNNCYNGPNKSKLLLSVNVGYIIKQVLPDITGVFFDGDFGRLMVLGSYHPSYQIKDDSQAWNINPKTQYAYVRLQDFQPDVPFADFLCNILKLPCASMFIVDGKPVVEFNKDIFNRSTYVNWGDRIIGTPQISYLEGERYSAGYSNIVDEEIPVETSILEESTIEYMINPAISSEGNPMYDGRYIKVLSTGQIFKASVSKTLSTDTKYFYDYTLISDDKEKEVDSTDKRGEFDMLFSGAAVQMTVAVDVQQDAKMKPAFTKTNTNHHRVYCPEFEYDSSAKNERPDQLVVGLWLGIRPSIKSVADQTSFGYPLLSKYNKTPWGSVACATSLAWDGDSGLIEKYHKEYKAWVEKPKKSLKAKALLSNIDLHNLDLRDKVYLDGRNFFIKELSITLKANFMEPADVELVEI